MSNANALTDKNLIRLSEAIKKFDGEWIAFKEQDNTDDPIGKVLYHSNNKEQFEKEVLRRKLVNCYFTYCGEIFEKDVAYLLCMPA